MAVALFGSVVVKQTTTTQLVAFISWPLAIGQNTPMGTAN
jgi:hypothetical protein